jgi:uncharacterized YccA/Bax inhibitor family protein
MRSYVNSDNRAAVRWCGGLGLLLAATGVVLVAVGEEKSLPFNAGIITVIVALVLVGIAGYAWLDDVAEAWSLRRRGRRSRSR